MLTNTNFSQHRCREMAATQRLMMEMPESKLSLVTRIATIISCDYDGAMRLQECADAIQNFSNREECIVKDCFMPRMGGRSFCREHDSTDV